MSFTDDLITILTDYNGGYRLMRKRIMGDIEYSPYTKIKSKPFKDTTLRATLSRLKKQGLIKNENKIWALTEKGKEYIKSKIIQKFSHTNYIINKNKSENTIIIFDIPEKYRKKRAWLRYELTILGFKIIQKSVWIGPSPLPKEFIKNLDNLNVLNYIKFFKVKEKNII